MPASPRDSLNHGVDGLAPEGFEGRTSDTKPPVPRGAVTPEREDQSGQVVGGRYRLLRRIGAGSMGAVYEATGADGHRWAVKLMHPRPRPGAPEDARRFAREVRALESVSDPHVVTIVDANPDAQQPWFVTELLAGESVEALLQRIDCLEPRAAAAMALQVARGLGAAHASGLLHRDVKPSNVFLHAPGDGSIVAKLLDFGVAKVLFDDDSLTESGDLLGTPHYMAPEQIRDAKRVDERTDVYSLGAMLYRMLTGTAPFEGSASRQELTVRIMTEAPPPLQRRASWVEPRIARLVHTTLLRDRDARCPSIEALLGHLADLGPPGLTQADLHAPAAALRASTAPSALLPASWSEIERDAATAAPGGAPRELSLEGATLTGSRVYRLKRALGAGAMGVVYEAEATPGGDEVAVKVLSSDAARRPGAARRLVHEARAAQRLQGPHVVRVIEADVDAGTPFVVMELLRGKNLGETIGKLDRLAPEAAARVFMQACEGLAEAHEQGLVHRDVKPTNLFLHEAGEGEIVVKLVDFGLVKEADGDGSDLTRTGSAIGSPAYMAPEQIDDAKHVDARADLWSVGASLFEALTGRRLWSENLGPLALVRAIAMEEPPSVRERAPWVDEGLDGVVQRALKKRAADRFPSARALADALRPFAGGGVRLDPAMLALDSARSAGTVLPPERGMRSRWVVGGVMALAVVSGSVIAITRSGEPVRPSSGATSEPSRVAPTPSTPPSSTEARVPAAIPASASSPALPPSAAPASPAPAPPPRKATIPRSAAATPTGASEVPNFSEPAASATPALHRDFPAKSEF